MRASSPDSAMLCIPLPKAGQSVEHIKLGALVERRRQLLDLVNQKQNRLQQTADSGIRNSIQTVLKGLKAQVKTMDNRIAKSR